MGKKPIRLSRLEEKNWKPGIEREGEGGAKPNNRWLTSTNGVLQVTVISAAQIKTPIVSFDDDVTAAAAAATELPESEAEMSTSAPEHGDADKPERLVALLSGVYSASAGYQPSADGSLIEHN